MKSMTVRTQRKPARKVSSAYLRLVEHFPLRPLRTEEDYDTAVAILDALAIRSEAKLDVGEADYLETLTMLVETYDRAHFQMSGNYDPLAMLKYIMEETRMTQADLGRLLGSRSLASQILGGNRRLSKANIRKLADHFKVSPALFFDA